jgi:hypothetical protein
MAVRQGAINPALAPISCIVLADAWPYWLYVLHTVGLSCQAVFTLWEGSATLATSFPVYPLASLPSAQCIPQLSFNVILIQSKVWSTREILPPCLHPYPILWSLPRGENGINLVSDTRVYNFTLRHTQVGGVMGDTGTLSPPTHSILWPQGNRLLHNDVCDTLSTWLTGRTSG